MSKSNWNNPYWGSYRQIEKRLIELSHTIYFDDKQLDVYSSEIADMILSVSSKIESILKDIFESHFYISLVDLERRPLSKISKSKKFDINDWTRDKWKYDFDCLREIENVLALSKKLVVIDSPNFHFTRYQNIIRPFARINERAKWDFLGGDWKVSIPREVQFHITEIYEPINWNKNYQAVKHNYNESLSENANLKTLIMSLAAFYLLLIYLEYYKSSRYVAQEHITYDIQKDLESDIFSVFIHNDFEPKYFSNPVFDKLFMQHNADEKDKAVLLRIFHKSKYDKLIQFEKRYKQSFPEKDYCNLSLLDSKKDIDPNEKPLLVEAKRILSSIPSDFMIILNENSNDSYSFHTFDWIEYMKSKYENRRNRVLSEMKVGDNVNFITTFRDVIEGEIIELTSNSICVKSKNITNRMPLSNISSIEIMNEK